MAFVGVVIMVFGALGFALGIVHTIAPDLKSGNAIQSIASSLVNIAGSVASDANNNGTDVPPAVTKGISSAKSELRRQSRNHAVDEMLRGLFMALLGLAVYLFHMKRTAVGLPGGATAGSAYAAGLAAGMAAPHTPPPSWTSPTTTTPAAPPPPSPPA
jgi:hypothetical protein